MNILYDLYYWLDLLIGFAAPIFIFIFIRQKWLSKSMGKLFIVGCLLGLLWEIPIFYFSVANIFMPVISWVRPLPLHYSVFIVCHTLWDGLLFIVGLRLIQFIDKNYFQSLQYRHWLLYILWGVLSAVTVELSAIANDAWVYKEGHSFNPVLIMFQGKPITSMILVIWFFAAAAFYPYAIKVLAKDVE